jgi:hypothetical protein
VIEQAKNDTENLTPFRDDLRQPKVVFGRCCLTGEWGKCIALDLGDVSIQMPEIERGVELDPETNEVKFNFWKPLVFQNQATFSERGLQLLSDYLASQDSPIPGVTPILFYAWQVMYNDGSALGQFVADLENPGEEIEINSNEIDFDRVTQISLVPRHTTELPTYTLDKATGKIFRAGEEIDLMYEGVYNPDSSIVYARKVTHTWGSQVFNLDREITNTHTTVLQLMGWKVGGLKGPGPGLIIAVDDRGNWRPWEYC